MSIAQYHCMYCLKTEFAPRNEAMYCIEIWRQTDRQAGRQGRQRERERATQKHRETDRQKDTQRERETDRARETDRQKQIVRETRKRQTDRQTDRHRHKQTYRQREKQQPIWTSRLPQTDTVIAEPLPSQRLQRTVPINPSL